MVKYFCIKTKLKLYICESKLMLRSDRPRQPMLWRWTLTCALAKTTWPLSTCPMGPLITQTWITSQDRALPWTHGKITNLQKAKECSGSLFWFFPQESQEPSWKINSGKFAAAQWNSKDEKSPTRWKKLEQRGMPTMIQQKEHWHRYCCYFLQSSQTHWNQRLTCWGCRSDGISKYIIWEKFALIIIRKKIYFLPYWCHIMTEKADVISPVEYLSCALLLYA